MDNKICGICGQEKSLKEFYRRSGSSDGRQYHCKECQKNYNKKTHRLPFSTKIVKGKLASLGFPVSFGKDAGMPYTDLAVFGFIPVEAKSSKDHRENFYSFGFSPRQSRKRIRNGFVILVTNDVVKRFFVIPYQNPMFNQSRRFVVTLDSEHSNAKNWRWLKKFENRFDLIVDAARERCDIITNG